MLLAQVPQTARVNKKELKAPEVSYQGDPQFEPIEKTTVARAVNTDKDIIKVGDLYYMCFQGVWFMARKARRVRGRSPARCRSRSTRSRSARPAHNVTYVTVVEDDRRRLGDVCGRRRLHRHDGRVGLRRVGHGYYYPPYVGYGGYYPVYYPYYPTYGYAAWYNPWTGTYGRGAVAYGPYGGAGAAARYNPRTGTYARGAAAYGPYGARGAAQAYNPRTGAYAQTRQGSGVYGSWGSTGVQRGDDWAQTSRVTNHVTGNTTRVDPHRRRRAWSAARRTGGGGFVAAGDEGNVYAGHDGNVYKRQDGGGWQKYDNGGWTNTERPAQGGGTGERPTTTDRSAAPTQRPTGTTGQLDRDRAARAEGATRTRDYGSYRGGGGSAGSYRATPSRGGGGRGGGRRR